MKNLRLCIVTLKGGFGNQLFQYNFANYMQENGYRVKIDESFFETTVTKSGITHREKILENKYFGFKKVTKFEKVLINLLIKINSSKKIKRFKNFYNHYLFNYVKEKNFDLKSNSTQIIYCDGYWQDLKFIINDAEFIKEKLQNIKLIHDALSREVDPNSFLIIVRRGDYIEMGQDLKIEYYKKCIAIINSYPVIPKINIFTDDVEWVKNQEIFRNVNSIYGPQDSPNGVIHLFSKMLQHKHFFVGNSTLSFFAALIGKTKDSDIYVADPWFRKRESKNLIHKNWLRINNF